MKVRIQLSPPLASRRRPPPPSPPQQASPAAPPPAATSTPEDKRFRTPSLSPRRSRSLSSRSPSSSPSRDGPRRRRRRPTEIGWDTEDDEDYYRRSRDDYRRMRRRRSRSGDREEFQRSRYRRDHHYQDRAPAAPVAAVADAFQGLDLCVDASRTKMLLRKRALALRKFTVIRRDDGMPLEENPEFSAAMREANAEPLIYTRRDPPKEEGRNRRRLRGVSLYPRPASIGNEVPGSGERHHVAWSAPNGDIHVDRGVKIYDFDSIQEYEIDGLTASPSSPWFGLIDPREVATFDNKVNFDANMFWTVGLLVRYFRTCGVARWDREIADLRRFHELAENNILCGGPNNNLAINNRADALTINNNNNGYAAAPGPAAIPFHHDPPGARQHREAAAYSSRPQLQPLMQIAVPPPPPPPPQQQHQHMMPPPQLPLMQQQLPPPSVGAAMGTETHPQVTHTSAPVNIPLTAGGGEGEMEGEEVVGPGHYGGGPLNANSGERYTGCIVEWLGTYGLIACTLIPERVFIHYSEICGGSSGFASFVVGSTVGISINFELEYDRNRKRYHAVKARTFV